MPESEIASFQKEIANKPVGERIALWAEKFVGTPYDPDPLGEYVVKSAIIADERVDCMYLSFRSLELALGATPEEAISIALNKRFITKGKLGNRGNVLNYEDRFQYGEDMLDSGKWGKEVTEKLGRVAEIEGSRGRKTVKIISKKTMLKLLKSSKRLKRQKGKASNTLKDGDFIFFIKAVEKRRVGEIVGHIGIIKVEDKGQRVKGSKGQKGRKEIYLIHASGYKNRGGEVRKVRLYDYVSSMPFIGLKVSRFE